MSNFSSSPRTWFSQFMLYNLVFLSLQVGFILAQGGGFLRAVPLPTIVYVELALTLGLHVGLYLLLSLLQTGLLCGVVKRRPNPAAVEYWHVAIWTLSACALLTINAYFFPLSIFSRKFLPELPHTLLLVLMLFSLLPLGLLALNALLMSSRKFLAVIFLPLFLWSVFLISPKLAQVAPAMQTSQPNIIVIGVDSLSPGSISRQNTPNLAQFIQQSVQFEETISPLARTYPAWASILTGLYPYHHQAHYNLMPADLVNSQASIAWTMRDLGYQTVFATDDRRFNNLGKEFGFQHIIGPKLGVNDALLGTFNDFPLSNFLINLPIGQRLFPYNHLNRASHFSYYPQTFDTALHHELASRNHESPLFFAVHFTLPHWPYAWAQSSPAQVKDEYSVKEREQLYLAAIQQVDRQVATLLNNLKTQGYLENSLVILLSDHGETLYLPGTRQTSMTGYLGHGPSKLADYFVHKTSTALDMSSGHGSDLLSPEQYRCVLAFKIYKNQQLTTPAKKIKTRVALIDIAPTITQFLSVPMQQSPDGISLLGAIQNHNEPLPERAFIMESGMLPNQFLSREKARVLGKKFFTVTPNGQLQLHKQELPTLDAMKLYAIIKGDFILALYPDDKGYIPVTLRLSDRRWVDELSHEFALKAPSRHLLTQLQQIYQNPFILQPQLH